MDEGKYKKILKIDCVIFIGSESEQNHLACVIQWIKTVLLS